MVQKGDAINFILCFGASQGISLNNDNIYKKALAKVPQKEHENKANPCMTTDL